MIKIPALVFQYVIVYVTLPVMFLITVPLHAQTIVIEDTTQMYIIRTSDGNEFSGQVIAKDMDKVILETELYGTITIPVKNIKSINAVESREIIDGVVWPDNPQSTRYFWAPNGYGIKKGEAYYQNIWILFNQASIGITDYFSLSAGMIPLFLFAGTPTPVWIVPKFSIPAIENKLNFGFGALTGAILGESEAGFGILFGDITVGSRNSNATFGVGYGFAGGEWAQAPTINFSFFKRVSKNSYIISENYLLPLPNETIGIISFGGRSIVKRAGIDYGLILPLGISEFIAIPILGITLPLSK